MAEQQDRTVKGTFSFAHSKRLHELFSALNISLFVTTYQAHRLLSFFTAPRGLKMLARSLDRPTGLTIRGNRMAVVSHTQVWIFEAHRGLTDSSGKTIPGQWAVVPRCSFTTGHISGHEIDWLQEGLVVVNTRFSCLAKVSPDFSFVPFWRPQFITEYAPDDRCHLNGMAVENLQARYVTALGESNIEEGWRDEKRTGGIVIDVASGEIISRGISMPHSPRLYAGKLWLLESGCGELQVLDPKSAVRETVAAFPGYARGLAFYRNYAFVAVSKVRETNIFGGLQIQEIYDELKCGIYVLDINTGRTEGLIEITSGIEELFDVAVMANCSEPHLVGIGDDSVDDIFIYDR